MVSHAASLASLHAHVRVRRCFGLFDGPKGPETTPVFGCLRTRPTSVLARRFNAEAYRALPLEGQEAAGAFQQVPSRAPGQRTLEGCMRGSAQKRAGGAAQEGEGAD